MEKLFEQHIERMEKLQSVYEPHTGQHNILGILINECKQALHKHGVSNSVFYDELARRVGLIEVGVNKWVNEYGQLYMLTKYGFVKYNN